MRKVTSYKNKKILILGTGMSGINAAKLLMKLGADVTLSDNQPVSKIPKAKHLADTTPAKLIAGKQTPDILDNHYDLMVKNPGISYDNPVVQRALAINLPMIVEVEIASEINPGELINVTGSNGKTTTTMLITRMLNQHRPEGKTYDAGNIGISASQVAQKMSPKDTMVMEISSFMLLGITTLHPHIAVITNIKSNHLDYHKTRANYVRAKMRITKNQTSDDYLILNFNSPEMRELSKSSKAQIVPFCTDGYTKAGAYEQDGKLYFRGHYVMDAKDIKIHGQYNVENALAAIAVAKLNHRSDQDIHHVLATFSGASNRNQYVLTYDGRIFFNDSKSTDIDSTEAALESFHHPIILLCGGLDRGYKFDRLVPDLKKYVKGLVAFGQTKQLMKDAAEKAGISQIKVVDNIDQAVPAAYKMSSKGSIILLSPANASWDQYPNFEVRGARYVKDIEKLTGKKRQK
ncbi:UDP-N-acetylmuramoyl-L-alanine--D-glutamate ligase [Acetilactobacillus jinshanensis]|uniref:UDP-N-acetylmuramoylalanine--D-glutamate ligase n=1 Tax=Acetilactobacillus jinshanensis TaxID=1720083 RepID=A0A4P6ZK61_9LACO|nr:UDP-N-acetylmuramoyl-L-alanine--D-glutamate ligase [Acetilactobacillus jinshanensis]QBP17897.1 UDP-N-acetylmuramoyl-L-alanine--D-glutamate ligase [Acetilactobacillus jinshanensis]URL60759.1 UDP-N-acetylmuramoyl-L-alanine--D-glutamate ligase [uncultured bacterium]